MVNFKAWHLTTSVYIQLYWEMKNLVKSTVIVYRCSPGLLLRGSDVSSSFKIVIFRNLKTTVALICKNLVHPLIDELASPEHSPEIHGTNMAEMVILFSYNWFYADLDPALIGKVATVEALRFMIDCLKAVGSSTKPAEQQAELLLQADRFGHPSHGLNRIELYVNDILAGSCKPNNQPKVLKETQATAWIDANNVLGATASHFAVDIAIKKAKETGVGWVAVKGSNHNGMAGFWSQKAADKGLIGMAFTNTSPLLAPTRSKEPALGTNPISVVAPASQNESFYLDMATTAVALGKAFKSGCLMPLGGSEMNSGYKGYGLSAMVELFCGVLAGANYGHHVRSWKDSRIGPANLGHCFVAINPDCFAPGFGDRLTDCILYWRQLEPTDPCLPVLALGDKEKKAAAETDARGTVPYVKQQIESCAELAKKLKVKQMEVKFG